MPHKLMILKRLKMINKTQYTNQYTTKTIWPPLMESYLLLPQIIVAVCKLYDS